MAGAESDCVFCFVVLAWGQCPRDVRGGQQGRQQGEEQIPQHPPL